MSDLQTVLIVIGALIIVAVLVVNWWQERRFHQQVESNFSSLQSDALLDDPKLDLDSLSDNPDDSDLDGFVLDNALSDQTLPDNHEIEDLPINPQYVERFVNPTQHHSSDNTLPEDVSIDAAYSELANAISARHSEHEINSNLNADVKPVQRNEIKAIFNEAFSHTNKVASHDNVTPLAAVEGLKIGAPKAEVSATRDSATQHDIQEPAIGLPAMIHAQMDLTAVLYLATDASVGMLTNSLTGLLDDYDKPVFVHILDSNNQWFLLKDLALNPELLNKQVSRVACSLQLADRAGAASRNVLNRFQLAVETFGLDMNAHVEWQSTGDALTTAKALDAFCIEVDKTIGFHLLHGENGAFTGTKLRGLAEAQGLTLTSDGAFKYFDEPSAKQAPSTQLSTKQPSAKQQVQPSFVMFNRDDHPFSPEMLRSSVIKGVTFQLDIPHVKHCAEAFSQMVQVARQMEIGLNALLVDDNNKVLGDMQIEKIRQQLKVIHATMLVRGIVPSSDSARRLFS